MCGICGLVGVARFETVLRAMLERLLHRGPDSNAIWMGEGVGLGHARLAIVDISPAGNQPMPNEDGDLILVANGEIYNNSVLRSPLHEGGHAFRGNSDNECLLHLYEEHGLDFLPMLNGMFAFGLWDQGPKRLLLARDRLGIKPLYYTSLPGGGLAFASEIKALFACPGAVRGIDPQGLGQYLTYANTFGPTTMHANVREMEPGQYLLWQDGSITLGSYWSPCFCLDQAMDLASAGEAYLQVLRRSVNRHLISDVGVASYLSSGFDSTAVAAMAASMLDTPLRTYTGYFAKDGWYDERPGAVAVARRIQSQHENVLISADQLRAFMSDLLYALDEPRMGMGSFSQYIVARTAARDCKVILTGHGGDELFAGYPVFKLAGLASALSQRSSLLWSYLGHTNPSEWPHLIYFLLQATASRSKGIFLPTLFSSAMLRQGLRPEVHRVLSDHKPEEEIQKLIKDGADSYQRLTLTYLRAYLPGLFVVEDKISMAHALESRTPLCDNEMVDLALTIPLSVKLEGGVLKAVPKSVLRGLLPSELYHTPKRGFPTPLAGWLREELKAMVQEIFHDQDTPLASLFKPEFLARVSDSYFNSWKRQIRPLDEIQTHRIWLFWSLHAWLNNAKDRLGTALSLCC